MTTAEQAEMIGRNIGRVIIPLFLGILMYDWLRKKWKKTKEGTP